MRKSRNDRNHPVPPLLSVQTSSSPTPSYCSGSVSSIPSFHTSNSSSWDADAESMSSQDGYQFSPREPQKSSSRKSPKQRPMSLALPVGPYCPRRPTLKEVLGNNAPPPWTLSAFMAYLSQNHCLETLEFTLDASRYRKYYADLMVDDASIAYGPDIGIRFGEAENKERLRQLWRKLVNAYIMPNASREVNLPSYVRDKLLNLTSIPPDPSVLDEAVKLVYELMDESVFVSFLNTVTEEKKSLWGTSSEDLDECPKDDDRPTRSFSPSRHNRESSPIASSISSLGERYLPKFSQRSHLSDAIKRSRKDANHPASASNGSNYITSPTYESDLSTGFGNFGLTEDSSTDSPASVNGSLNMDLLTPPVTPPTCDSYLPDDSEQESQWKKMGRTLGFSRGNVMGLSYRKSMKGRGKREKGVTSGGDTLSPMSSSSSASEPRGLQIQGLEWVDEDGRIR